MGSTNVEADDGFDIDGRGAEIWFADNELRERLFAIEKTVFGETESTRLKMEVWRDGDVGADSDAKFKGGTLDCGLGSRVAVVGRATVGADNWLEIAGRGAEGGLASNRVERRPLVSVEIVGRVTELSGLWIEV